MCISPVLFRFSNPKHPKQVFGIGAPVREDMRPVSLSQFKRAIGQKPKRGDGQIYKRGARVVTPRHYSPCRVDFEKDPLGFAIAHNLPVYGKVPSWSAADLDDDPIGKPLSRIRGLYRPFVLLTPEESSLAMFVPCGRCAQCLQKKVNEWTFRLSHDMACTKNLCAFYVTLTFRPSDLPTDAHVSSRVPASREFLRRAYRSARTSKDKIEILRSLVPYKHIGDAQYIHDDCGLLDYKTFQDFKQRLKITLKRWYGIDNLKFFVCGEYGKNTARPHFHAVIWFTLTEQARLGYSCELPKRGKAKDSLFYRYIQLFGRVPSLDEHTFKRLCFRCWSHSDWQAFDCSPVRSSAATSRYITKYMLKNKLFLARHLRELDRVCACPPCFHRSCKLAYNWAEIFARDITSVNNPLESIPIKWKDKNTGLVRHSVDVVPLVLARHASDVSAERGHSFGLTAFLSARASRCMVDILERSETAPVDIDHITSNLRLSTYQMDKYE